MARKKLSDMVREEAGNLPNATEPEAPQPEEPAQKSTAKTTTRRTTSGSSSARSATPKSEETIVPDSNVESESVNQLKQQVAELQAALEASQNQVDRLQAELKTEQSNNQALQKELAKFDQVKSELEEAKQLALKLSAANQAAQAAPKAAQAAPKATTPAPAHHSMSPSTQLAVRRMTDHYEPRPTQSGSLLSDTDLGWVD